MMKINRIKLTRYQCNNPKCGQWYPKKVATCKGCGGKGKVQVAINAK